MASLSLACVPLQREYAPTDQVRLTEQAAKLLDAQWPRSAVSGQGWRALLAKSASNLPLHIVGALVSADDDRTVVAHASLHPSTIQGDARNVILQSLVVDHALRGKGVGRRFLELVEREASRRGFGYMFLSTTDQQDFYRRCGYRECEPVNLDVPVLAARKTALSGLEGLLRKKLEAEADGLAAPAIAGHASSSAALASSSLPHTWFQKRLRAFPAKEETRPVQWREDWFLSELPRLLASQSGVSACPPTFIEGFCHELAWMRQIGPSCGLTALLMLTDTIASPPSSSTCLKSHRFTIKPTDAAATGATSGSSGAGALAFEVRPCDAALTKPAAVDDPRPRLLDDCIARRITTDGEVFSIDGLAEAAIDVCGLGAAGDEERGAGRITVFKPKPAIADGDEASKETFRAFKAALRAQVTSPTSDRVVFLVAYDADTTDSYRPAHHNGASAHWAIVAGAAWPAAASDNSASGGDDDSDIAVLLVHSASSLPLACSLRALARSNAQLKHADARRARLNNWVIASDGEGLLLDLKGFIAVRL